MENDPLLLTVTAAAKLMSLSRWTLQGKLRRFELRYIPLGRRHKRIPRAEVERWIRENTVGSHEELRSALDGRRKS